MTGGGAPGTPPAPRWIAAEGLPGRFGELSRPPAGLWCAGDSAALGGAPDRHVAIVGTREASAYGVRTAARLAEACVRAGLVVVSGLARGVDAAAHEAALKAGGLTIAVLGTGVDVPYPAGHRSLLEAIAGRGLAVSEVEPGTRAAPGCFPRRNRLIAALAKVTVVVEAGHKSGAINTATQSLELGRTVAAVPGLIDDPRAAGANGLIRDGAQVICGVEDLLSLFGTSTTGGFGAPAGSPHGTGPADSGAAPLRRDPWAEIGGVADEVPTRGGASLRQVSLRLLSAELGESPGQAGAEEEWDHAPPPGPYA